MELIGLNELKCSLASILEKADAYRKGGARVPHIMMNLTQNNGQSAAADYVASVLYENRLRKFCGLDLLLEYRPDGGLKNLRQMFADIRDNAVYTNEYEGVIAMDISALSEYINEYQVEYFTEQIKEVSRSATLIIYYDDSLGKRMKQVKDMVSKAIGNCIDVYVTPYSLRDYSEIVVQSIKERGIEVDDGEDFEAELCDVVGRYGVSNVRQAVSVAEDLVFYADYSDLTPKLDIKAVSRHLICS
ncbi:MAG: hypothetical protein K5886_04405 [Lachnospiraceae bacterium]|nr:hypothetical protein [Lachnospiraceae bacterium]